MDSAAPSSAPGAPARRADIFRRERVKTPKSEERRPARERMLELKELREADMITADEYTTKRKAVLDEL